MSKAEETVLLVLIQFILLILKVFKVINWDIVIIFIPAYLIVILFIMEFISYYRIIKRNKKEHGR